MFEWLVARAAERQELEVGEAPPGLLDPTERELLAALRFPARRKKWLMGRWAAKRLLVQALARAGRPCALEALTILNEPAGAPYALLEGRRLDWSLSISHRDELAVAAVCTAPQVALGIDLELVLPRDEVLVRDFFAPAEIDVLPPVAGRPRQLGVARAWSVKESVLKALGVGLRLDTRGIVVGDDSPSSRWPPGWAGVAVAVTPWPAEVPQRLLFACWRDEGAFVLSAAVAT